MYGTFELVVVVAAIVVMVRVADAERRSPVIWGAITFGLCFLSFMIPLPFLRVGIALVVSYGAMFACKLLGQR